MRSACVCGKPCREQGSAANQLSSTDHDAGDGPASPKSRPLSKGFHANLIQNLHPDATDRVFTFSGSRQESETHTSDRDLRQRGELPEPPTAQPPIGLEPGGRVWDADFNVTRLHSDEHAA
jgi:hypothetical protein